MLAEDRNQMKTNARWKLGKEWGCIDENRNRTLHNLISIYTLDVRCKSLTLQVFLQVHDCMYVCICEYVYVCLSHEHLHMCKQMFCVSDAKQRSGPSIFLSSSYPLLSFHKHLFFRAVWVTPASQWRRRGVSSPSKQLELQERSLPPIWSEQSARKLGNGKVT